MPKPYNTNKKRILFFGDLLLIILSTYFSIFVRFSGRIPATVNFPGATALVAIIYFMSLYLFDLYNPDSKVKSTSYLSRYFFAILTASLSMAIAFYFFPPWKIGRGIFFIDGLVLFFLLYLWRLFFEISFALTRKPKVIAIAGSGWAGRSIYNVLVKNGDFVVRGFIDDDPEKKDSIVEDHRVIGDSSLIVDMARNKEVDAVVVAITHERSQQFLGELVDAKMYGIEVYDMPSLYEELTGKLPVNHLRNWWLLFTPFYGMKGSLYMKKMKRLVDVVCSLFGLAAFSPVALLAACVIKLDSSGPVLFRQKRVGYDGEVYELLKFRSMKIDAESNGAVWALENDPRVTRSGRIMRKTRLDEIPQMWNVLKGEMSFVGPRPERPEFVEDLKEEIPFYSLRHCVKPGITGWAQVHYRYGASKADALEKLQYDLFYIKNLSPFLDLSILLKTVRVVLFVKGSR